jgi:hypothetical protein
VSFMVGNLALGQVSLKVLRFCIANYDFTNASYSFICHLGMDNGPEAAVPSGHSVTPTYKNEKKSLLVTSELSDAQPRDG